MRYFRNLGRRPGRTALTILGHHDRHLVAGRVRVDGQQDHRPGGRRVDLLPDKITIADASGQLGGFASAPMSLTPPTVIRAVDGVDVVTRW